MKTTNLFIELLVIGVGAMLCLCLMYHLIFGFEYIDTLPFDHTIFLLPITATTYVLGIVFDRIFDITTDRWDKSIRKQSDMTILYNKARVEFYDHSKVIQDVFDYTKNRIRIVRSWMFYFIILAILVLFLFEFKLQSRIIASLVLLLLSLFSVITFRKLTYSFYGLLRSASLQMVKRKTSII